MAEPNEINTYRNEVVWNHTAGAMIFNNTTGQETVSIAHRGGASLVFGNQTSSDSIMVAGAVILTLVEPFISVNLESI